MTTPLATIADALIEFILSLLRDPAAAAEFEADPEQTLARRGLEDICATDVRSVVPVVVERPDVVAKPVFIPTGSPSYPSGPPAPKPVPEVVREIMNVANNFHIDNRSTIVDQSVNQNIWAQGDVTQIFDQEAALAVGDNSVAAADNVLIDESNTEVTTGDVEIGNTETNIDIDDSFNDESTNVDVAVDTEVEGSFNQDSTDVTLNADIDDSFNDTSSTVISTDIDVSAPAPEPVPMSYVEADESASYVDETIDVELPSDLDFEES